ncbi:MAG: YggS family pyridoxal phosphate-dependent enzyme [bacterium]
MHQLEQNLSRIRSDIDRFCDQYHRKDCSVNLVAVGKKHPVDKILALAAAGQCEFGENYLQEAVEKIEFCRHTRQPSDPALVWHFIGHIQSRKCKDIAAYFDWVHTIESYKVARKLSQHRSGDQLNVMIQVNIDNEESKSGVDPAELLPLASEVATLPNLRLRGLMIIPKEENEFSKQRRVFSQCRELLDALNRDGLALDQLSMGMTNDMEAAIAEGATQVRIGTALFGPRPTSP